MDYFFILPFYAGNFPSHLVFSAMPRASKKLLRFITFRQWEFFNRRRNLFAEKGRIGEQSERIQIKYFLEINAQPLWRGKIMREVKALMSNWLEFYFAIGSGSQTLRTSTSSCTLWVILHRFSLLSITLNRSSRLKVIHILTLGFPGNRIIFHFVPESDEETRIEQRAINIFSLRRDWVCHGASRRRGRIKLWKTICIERSCTDCAPVLCRHR